MVKFLFIFLLPSFWISLTIQAAPVPSRGGVTRWDRSESSPTLRYYIDSKDAAVIADTHTSFTEWTISTSYLTFSETQEMGAANIVVSTPSSVAAYGAGDGEATPEFDSSGHTIIFCRASVVPADISDPERRQFVLTHEIGHCLGLMHSAVRGAVMSITEYGNHVSPDDQMALTALYPRGGGGLPAGCASLKAAGGHPLKGRDSAPFYEFLLFSSLFFGIFWIFRLNPSPDTKTDRILTKH
jgi:hypothetical protein